MTTLQSSALLAAAAILLFALPTACLADVKPSAIFAADAVLQRNADVPVWGTAVDGESVTVSFDGQTASTTAMGGVWHVNLKPMTAGGPYTLTISGPKNTVTTPNLYVGEVWLCSGQSNMGFAVAQMANATDIKASSIDPMLHLCFVGGQVSDTPKASDSFNWTDCAKGVSGGFSAVGYVFGRELRKALGVPVGIIESAVGGTVAEAWTSDDALSQDPQFQYMFDNYKSDLAKYPAVLQDYNTRLPDLQTAYTAAKAKYDADCAAIKAKFDADTAAATASGSQAPTAPLYPRAPTPPRPPASPAMDANYAGHLYNGMIAPIAPYAIKGAVWYQGESNVSRAEEYRHLLPTLIRSWRKTWGEGDFPFIVIQLPPIGATPVNPQLSAWSELREAQRLTALDEKNVGLVVLTDISDETALHPTKKEPVGVRAAQVARAMAYGDKPQAFGPQYDGMKIEGGNVVVHFKNADGLTATGPITGFQVAGADDKWQVATADIRGRDVVVSSPAVPTPTQVRLGWGDFPAINLKNGAGFGAGPFRSDESVWHTRRPAAPTP